MATPLFPRLPLELWDHIIGQFELHHRSDYNALSNFSIASSSSVLLDRCRRQLFARVRISKPAHAERLMKVFASHDKLAIHAKHLLIAPDGPLKKKEESEEDDDDDDDSGEEEEEEEEGMKWGRDDNPFEHPSLLELLSKFTSVESVALLGDQEISAHYTERWHSSSIEDWIKFLSLPSITALSLAQVAFPIDLFGRSPNLKRLHLCYILVPPGYYMDHAVGAFPELETLEVYQSDLMGTGLYTFVKLGYLNEKIKSTTLKSLTLHGDVSDFILRQDHWAWIDTLFVFTNFGSDTLTSLTLTFSFGFRQEDDSFFNHWRDRPEEIGGHISQLRCLEILHFKFTVSRDMDRFFDLEYHGHTAFEPFLPIVVQGLIKGKEATTSPLKLLSIDVASLSGYFIVWPLILSDVRVPGSLDIDGLNMFSQALLRAPIWGKLDKWWANDLSTLESTPHLRVIFDFKPSTPVDFNSLLLEPLLAQMPNLRKAKAVEAFLRASNETSLHEAG